MGSMYRRTNWEVLRSSYDRDPLFKAKATICKGIHCDANPCVSTPTFTLKDTKVKKSSSSY